MAENIKNITNNLIIKEGSKENFIHAKVDGINLFNKFGIHHGGISFLKPGYRVNRAHGDAHVLIYCTSGSGEVFRPEGTQTFNQGDMVLIPGHVPQNYGSNHEFSMVWIHLEPFHKRLSFMPHDTFKIWPAYNKQIQTLFDFIYAETHISKNINPLIIHTWSELVLTWLEREFKSNDSMSNIRHRRKLDDLWLEVCDNLSHPWTIKDLANKIHLSPAHLHTLSQALFKTTPMAMVTKLRLNKATVLLQNTDLKLGVIANMVGYTSPFSLSRLFKQHYGYSPKSLRS